MNDTIEILLVEDNPSDAKLTLRALQKSIPGVQVLHLSDGAEALDFIFARGKFASRDTRNQPKIILLDLKMPKVSGFEVLKEMKAHENTKAIPVVVMTSSKEHMDLDACYNLGVNSYVVKPFSLEQFSDAVAEIGLYWMTWNQFPGE